MENGTENISPKVITDIYRYLSQEDDVLQPADGAFVFGRAMPSLAAKAAELYHRQLVKYILISGGFGKDSGILIPLRIPEATFLGACAVMHRVPRSVLHIETKAKNSVDNSKNGLQMLIDRGLPHRSLILVAQPTALRRMTATFQRVLIDLDQTVSVTRVAAAYPFDSQNEADQTEALDEVYRLAHYPEWGWTVPQPDLPEEFVDYAERFRGAYWQQKMKTT